MIGVSDRQQRQSRISAFLPRRGLKLCDSPCLLSRACPKTWKSSFCHLKLKQDCPDKLNLPRDCALERDAKRRGNLFQKKWDCRSILFFLKQALKILKLNLPKWSFQIRIHRAEQKDRYSAGLIRRYPKRKSGSRPLTCNVLLCPSR